MYNVGTDEKGGALLWRSIEIEGIGVRMDAGKGMNGAEVREE